MGRKGIGKLAGFGLADRMRVTTWKGGECVDFSMDIDSMKLNAGVAQDVPDKRHYW